MAREWIHRFERDGRQFPINPQSCFCFECDAISWDVLEHFPETAATRVLHLLKDKHSPKELNEVLGELEWLRSTKSILATPKRADEGKEYEFEKGLKQLSVRLPDESSTETMVKRGWFGRSAKVYSNSGRDVAQRATALLLNRSLAQRDLQLEFIEPGEIRHPDLIVELSIEALKAAALAGKRMTVAVRIENISVEKLPSALDGHTISIRVECTDGSDLARQLKNLATSSPEPLSFWSKAVQADGLSGRVIVRPNHANYGDAAQALDEAGFKAIEIDLDAAFAANPALTPASMMPGLNRSAIYYANRLVAQRYFRLDPIASLFWRVYEGTPQRRSDPAGTNELAIDESGDIYPSRLLLGNPSFRAGNVLEGQFNEDLIGAFEDVGSVTTAPCRSCWIRNLCGGGNTAVHQALSGNHRAPNPAWCDAQRDWMTDAIAAFNILSTKGVNFTRVYSAINASARPSLFTMLRAAFKMTVILRPLEESDAPILSRWENWTRAAYFLYSEKGLLLATKYDREMDSLHPQGVDQEMIIARKTGEPIGLARFRMDREPGVSLVSLYMRNEADYTSAEVHKGLRMILEEAFKQQGLRRIVAPAMHHEAGLQQLLKAIGFAQEGTQREAVFVDGKYHDVHMYGLTVEA